MPMRGSLKDDTCKSTIVFPYVPLRGPYGHRSRPVGSSSGNCTVTGCSAYPSPATLDRSRERQPIAGYRCFPFQFFLKVSSHADHVFQGYGPPWPPHIPIVPTSPKRPYNQRERQHIMYKYKFCYLRVLLARLLPQMINTHQPK